MSHPFLTKFEVWLVRRLMRSPRIGLILIKQHGGVLSWVIEDKTDILPMEKTEAEEPPSMVLERLYHSPDAER